ncbi:MAG: KGK domain-containing protein [Cyanobacteria bacterium P01_A01_bin.17]
MKNSSKSKILSGDSHSDNVISVRKESSKGFMPHKTFTVEEFLTILKARLIGRTNDPTLIEGVPCNLLPVDGQWQEGTIKLALVFEPKEPAPKPQPSGDIENESPLDQIRQDATQTGAVT